MHAAVLPLLFVLAAGKLASVLAADGQGLPSDVAWATAYAGPGPWGSLGPEVPSHPSQVYEAIATTLVVVLVGLALRFGAFARRDGSALLAGLAVWALGRGIVAFTWRDAMVLGPFRAEHLALAVIVVGCIGGLLRLRLGGRSTSVVRARTTA
jgi:prolipoprotein diacylglyceryltransferase